jgi:hypothetical protein
LPDIKHLKDLIDTGIAGRAGVLSFPVNGGNAPLVCPSVRKSFVVGGGALGGRGLPMDFAGGRGKVPSLKA